MKSISTFVIAFLIIGFFFLALPEKGYSGLGLGGPPCCEIPSLDTCSGGEFALFNCENLDQCKDDSCVFFPNGICVEESEIFARCVQQDVVSAVPTLSQWGLIAIAVVLGIVGFMVIRRKKASA